MEVHGGGKMGLLHQQWKNKTPLISSYKDSTLPDKLNACPQAAMRVASKGHKLKFKKVLAVELDKYSIMYENVIFLETA